jgi:nitroreductase
MTNEIVKAVTEIFEKRKSIRAFSEEPVNEADINTIIESAASAPSAMNEQPWRFLLAFKKDKETYSKVLSALSEGIESGLKKLRCLL